MLKFRFVHRVKRGDYLIQKRSWLGTWHYAEYVTSFSSEGFADTSCYCDGDKEKLLETFLKAYNVGRETALLEYPMLVMR
jgi:hypothetical protein